MPPVKKSPERAGCRGVGARNPPAASIGIGSRAPPYHPLSSAAAVARPSARRGQTASSRRIRRSPLRIAGRAHAVRKASGSGERSSRPRASVSKKSSSGSRGASSQTTRADARAPEWLRSRRRSEILMSEVYPGGRHIESPHDFERRGPVGRGLSARGGRAAPRARATRISSPSSRTGARSRSRGLVNGVPDYRPAAMAAQQRSWRPTGSASRRSTRAAGPSRSRSTSEPRARRDERPRLRPPRAAAVGEQPRVLLPRCSSRRATSRRARDRSRSAPSSSGATSTRCRPRTRRRSGPGSARSPACSRRRRRT